MSSELEASARAAAEAYLTGLANKTNTGRHPELVALRVAGDTLTANPDPGPEIGKVVHVLVLHAGCTAVAQVQWAGRAGWLTLLVENGQWVVIDL